jgi:hypothetical protein
MRGMLEGFHSDARQMARQFIHPDIENEADDARQMMRQFIHPDPENEGDGLHHRSPHW